MIAYHEAMDCGREGRRGYPCFFPCLWQTACKSLWVPALLGQGGCVEGIGSPGRQYGVCMYLATHMYLVLTVARTPDLHVLLTFLSAGCGHSTSSWLHLNHTEQLALYCEREGRNRRFTQTAIAMHYMEHDTIRVSYLNWPRYNGILKAQF